MRLLTSYCLACWAAELIIVMIRWDHLCGLWRASEWYVYLLVSPVVLILVPIIRPIAFVYRTYRRFFLKD